MKHSATETPRRRRRFPRAALFGVAAGVIALLAILIPASVINRSHSFDGKLGAIVSAHRFSIAAWEMSHLVPDRHPASETDAVLRFFSLETDDPRRLDLLPTVEATLTRQVRSALVETGLDTPVVGRSIVFPPVRFTLTAPPRLLVISPRDRIAFQQQVLLQPGVTLPQIQSIEAQTDSLGVSSLVVGLGGFGATYPTIVNDGGSLEHVIETAIHEWLHQHLALRPLGFRYVLDALGLQQDPDVITINETVASMAAREIAAALLSDYYPDLATGTAPADDVFDREMRDIRQTVDTLLAGGKVEEAESFMEQRRQALVAQGYQIRKLNQAYFAFHGMYADSPASIDPIGEELRQLRARSPSLTEFLSTVSRMTTHDQLRASLR